MSQSDILVPVYYAASSSGAGYGHIYNVFLPPNTDTCLDHTSYCYSPDYRPTFSFCAYHSSVDIPGIGHVLYTVEPYQNNNACAYTNSLINSTGNTLLHELFETISDPDVGKGWYAPVFGGEIGDLCEPFQWSQIIGSNTYQTQTIYSDVNHACSSGP